MSIIRQGSLFSIQELYELEPTHRFEAIFSTIDIYPLLEVVDKRSHLGRPAENAKRTSVERVIGYLKEYFQLDNIRHRTGKRANVHFQLAVLTYNSAKLACDRLHHEIHIARRAA